MHEKRAAEVENEVHMDLLLKRKDEKRAAERLRTQEEEARINEKLCGKEREGLEDRILRCLEKGLGRAMEKRSPAPKKKRVDRGPDERTSIRRL